MQDPIQRREFVKRIGAGAAAGLTVMGQRSAAGSSANNTISIGCIGTGGRCRQLMGKLARIADVRMAAVCDVWDHNLNAAKELAD